MKKLLALTVCLMFLAAMDVFAEQEKEWEFGVEISNIKYEEPGVMEEEGVMYGVCCSYVYREGRVLSKVEGRYAFGQVDYKNSGTMDDIDDYILEFRGLGGYDFPVFKATIITPYIGFGYRYLNDDFTGTTSTGALGYEREANYYYSPIGIETITELDNDWSVGVTLEYDYFWEGKQKSHLSDARLYWDAIVGYYTYPDIENDQDSGYGVRGSVKLQKKTKEVDLIIEPYVRYWDIEDSERVYFSTVSENGLYTITASGIEPKNNSTEIGIKFAVKF